MNLAEVFFASARRSPGRQALQLPDSALTYAELEHHARSLCAALDRPGEQRIALLASRSVTAYAGVLGILAAGRSYVPLSASFPAARNRAILERVAAKTLVVGPECAAALAELLPLLEEPVRVVSLAALAGLDALSTGLAEHELAAGFCASSAAVAPHAPAYVLFTSGSTGQPKGVVVSHHNVLSYLRNFSELYPIHAEDRLTQTFELTFDLSVHDMFVCWAAGATLVVYPSSALSSPLEFTREQAVSVWFSVPSLVAHLETARKLDTLGLPELRLSLFCGEKLSYNAWQLWRRVAPNSRIVNLYGPTETTIAITHFEVPNGFQESDAPQGVMPIGRAFSGQAAEPKRPDGAAVGVGEVGELWLSGEQVSAGYLADAALSAERFVERGGVRWYRSGDRAARAPSGSLTFFGREDLQVKIMGYRVELGEVEHALRNASASAEAVALVLTRNGIEELVAALPVSAKPRKAAIRQALDAVLPGYMRPRRYCFLEAYPLNASGKVDRLALTRELAREPAS